MIILVAVISDSQCLSTCVWNVCARVAHKHAQTLSITEDVTVQGSCFTVVYTVVYNTEIHRLYTGILVLLYTYV